MTDKSTVTPIKPAAAASLQARVYECRNLCQVIACAADGEGTPCPPYAIWGAMQIAVRELQSIASAMEELE